MTSGGQLSKQKLASELYATHLVSRLLDFFVDTTPWPRRLWDISSVAALQELIDASGWVEERVLSSSSLSWYRHALGRQLGPDHGLGDSQLRKELGTLLHSELTANSQERRRLAQLQPLVACDYLTRWASRLDTVDPPAVERLARAIATHLLDCGHSSTQLQRWTTRMARADGATLEDLLRSAQLLANQPDDWFEVLVPFSSVPDAPTLAYPRPEWRSPADTSAWLRAQHPDMALPRHNGAFSYRVQSKDPEAAVRLAAAKIDRIQARRSFARGSRQGTHRLLTPLGQAWVAGQPRPFPLERPGRGAIVLSLGSEATMYIADANDRIDEALELAAPVNGGPASSAVTGAWAAIESLLNHPGEPTSRDGGGRVVAAERLASIVACSWPRAELTALSYRHAPEQADALSAQLDACQSNLERSTAIAEAIVAGDTLTLPRRSDDVALARMSKLLGAPRAGLADVQRTIANAFRRLYRQRNIVVHGGSTAAAALHGTLRTSAPLLGAGLDRLVHAQLTTGVAPLDLAARAENSLALVGDPYGPSVSQLLEPPGLL